MSKTYAEFQARIEAAKAKVLSWEPTAREVRHGGMSYVVCGEGKTFRRLASSPRPGDCWHGAALHLGPTKATGQ